MRSNKTNSKVIGIFVLGGVLLLLAGIVLFSATEWFSRQMQYVLYFDSSLNGLEIGSPVSFRGVSVGQVTNIIMEVDRKGNRVQTPVFVEIDPKRFTMNTHVESLSLLGDTPMKYMIKNGLRAQLLTKSWITGQMFIELELYPDYEAQFRAKEDLGVDEIPTIPSRFDQVQETLTDMLADIRKLPLEKLINHTIDTVDTAHATLYEMYQASHAVNEKLDSVLSNVDGASREGKETLVRLRKTLDGLDKAIAKANSVFTNIDKEVAATSPSLTKGAANASTAFAELATAMRALKELADYLERNPDALLTGKQDKR